jgi:hypothetical protein
VWAIRKSHVLILKSDFRFAVGADGEVLHIAGMVPVGTIEPVLLARQD